MHCITLPTNRAKVEPFCKTNAGNPHIQAFGILVRYSNSSLSNCYVVFFVGFVGKKQGVLSDFYLLRRFLGNCIVILLSLFSKNTPSFLLHLSQPIPQRLLQFIYIVLSKPYHQSSKHTYFSSHHHPTYIQT